MYYRKKGFTLIEILVVIFIISLVVSITYPVTMNLMDKFENYIKKAERTNLKNKEKFKKFLNDE